MIKKLIFDVDGVLIEADSIRYEKYFTLFMWGLELIKSPDYGGSSWMFEKLKDRYDRGVEIDPSMYRLIDPSTPKVLEELSKKFDLYACSLASKEITLSKLRSTGIDKYFKDVLLKPFKADHETAVIEDRKIDYGDCFFIKFNHGQYKDNADLTISNLTITSLNELLIFSENSQN